MLTKLTEKNRREYRATGGGMSYDHLRMRLEIIFDMLKYIMNTNGADHKITNFFAKAWEAVEPRELYWADQPDKDQSRLKPDPALELEGEGESDKS